MRFLPTALVSLLALGAASCDSSCSGIKAPPVDRASPRLATLTPSLTALAVHLDAREHLVGVSRHGPQVSGVPVVAGVRPNVEAVLYVEPDIVAIGKFPSNSADIARLRAIGRFRVMELGVVTLGDLRASALALGSALNRSPLALAFAERLDASLAAARASTISATRPRALVVYGRSGGIFYSTGGGDHVADILEALGVRNVTAGGPVSVRVSLERVIHLAPDTILHVMPEPDIKTTADAMTFWEKVAPTLPAVERGRIIAWSDNTLSLNGPEIVGAIASLTQRLEALPR